MSFTQEAIAKFDQLHSEIVDVDPGLAKHLRETCHFERQRPISSKNVERLAYEMRNGNFVKATPIFMAVLPDNSMLIVNGNHSLEAIASGLITIPLTFIYHRVNNVEEAAKIYITMDVHKTRSWATALQALGVKERVAMATKVLPAVAVINSDFNINSAGITQSRNATIERMEDYADDALLLSTFWEGTQKHLQKFLSRASYMAIALYTTRHQPKTAEEFWGGATRDDGLMRNDPRKQLLNYAITHKTQSRIDRQAELAMTIIAWNAFFENRTLEIMRPSQLKEMRILGTPWHKGKPMLKAETEKPTTTSNKKPSKLETGKKLTSKGIVPVTEYVG